MSGSAGPWPAGRRSLPADGYGFGYRRDQVRRSVGLHGRLGLVTVYRTLEVFEELGLARRVHLDEGCHVYVMSTPGHRHTLVCERCGRTLEFSGQDDLDELVARVEARTGFRVHEHLLQLLGVCPECLAAFSED
ncbi:MAG: Fur family transcriptional regulator [Anaerolineae bacterium]